MVNRATPIGWQIYPLGFTGAPVRPADDSERAVTHRLGHIVNWVDYLVELGCDMLVLGPIFASSTHGYDTLDFYAIDPRLGTEEDFQELVTACHDKGVSVVLDGVFNHVGSDHPQVRDALEKGRDSEFADLYSIDYDHNPPQPMNFEGHPGLVEFNHSEQKVTDLVADVMDYWCSRGVDGWRLDAVYAVDPNFWPAVLEKVRAKHPDVFIFGEMIHGDYPGYVSTSTIDSVTEYELWKACWSSLKEDNFFELQWTLKRHNEFLDTFTPITFIGNHDTTRIASYVGLQKAVVAAALLLSVGGHPIVYYGDERAWQAVKEEKLGGDDQVRPMFPATPEDLDSADEWMTDIYRQLIAMRRNRPWLTTARVEEHDITNTFYNFDCVSEDGSKRINVQLTAGENPAAVIHDGDEVIFEYRG